MTVVEDFRLYMRIKSNPGPAGVFKFIYAEMLVQKFWTCIHLKVHFGRHFPVLSA